MTLVDDDVKKLLDALMQFKFTRVKRIGLASCDVATPWLFVVLRTRDAAGAGSSTTSPTFQLSASPKRFYNLKTNVTVTTLMLVQASQLRCCRTIDLVQHTLCVCNEHSTQSQPSMCGQHVLLPVTCGHAALQLRQPMPPT